jgi:hypothetical protein
MKFLKISLPYDLTRAGAPPGLKWIVRQQVTTRPSMEHMDVPDPDPPDRRQRAKDVDMNGHSQPASMSAAMQAILSARALLQDQIGQSAHNGKPPDALAWSLLANHASEHAELVRQATEERTHYQATLECLSARFPEMPVAVDPPPPRAPQFVHRVARLLDKRAHPSSRARH